MLLIGLLPARPYASPYDGDGPATTGPAQPVAQKPGRFLGGVGDRPAMVRTRQGRATTGALAKPANHIPEVQLLGGATMDCSSCHTGTASWSN